MEIILGIALLSINTEFFTIEIAVSAIILTTLDLILHEHLFVLKLVRL